MRMILFGARPILDVAEFVGSNESLKGNKLAPQVLTHFFAVIVGGVPGEDLAFQIY